MGRCNSGVLSEKEDVDDLTIWKNTSGVFKKFVFFIFSILRLKEQPLEIMIQDVFIYVNFPLTFTAHMFGCLICFLALMYDNWSFLYLIPPISSLFCAAVVLFSLVFGWIFKTNRKVSAFLGALFMNCFFIASLCFTFKDRFLGSECIVFWMLPALSASTFGGGWFQMMFWCVFFFLGVCGHLLYRMIVLSFSPSTISISRLEMVHFYLVQFVCLCAVSFFCFFFTFFLRFQLQSFEKRTKRIVEGVVKLDFTSPNLVSFMSTPNQYCSPMNLMLKRICVTIQEYKKYLPQGLVISQQEDEEKERKKSIFHFVQHMISNRKKKKENNIISDESRSMNHHSSGSSEASEDEGNDSSGSTSSSSTASSSHHSEDNEEDDFIHSRKRKKKKKNKKNQQKKEESFHSSNDGSHSSSNSFSSRKRRGGKNNKKKSSSSSLIDSSVHSSFGTFMLIEFSFDSDFFFATTSRNSRYQQQQHEEEKEEEEKKEKEFQRFYQYSIDIVNKCTSQAKGFILSLTNEQILCSWNIKSRVVDHELNAIQSAMSIHEQFTKLKTKYKSSSSSFYSSFIQNCFLYVSISSGMCYSGFMGGSSIKGFQTFGKVHEKYKALNLFSKLIFDEEEDLPSINTTTTTIHQNTEEEEEEKVKYIKGAKGRNMILVDEATRNRIQFDYLTLFVNQVKVNRQSKSFGIFEVIGKSKKGENDEWMYEIFNNEDTERRRRQQKESKNFIPNDQSECEESLQRNAVEKIKIMNEIRDLISFENFEQAKFLFINFSKLDELHLQHSSSICPIFHFLQKIIWENKKFNVLRV